jgi:DNA-binding response OmpR family regulator
MSRNTHGNDLGKKLPASTSSLQGRKGLLVDDDVHMLNLLSKFLAVEGCSTDTALNGRLALSKIDRVAYDFILCDLKMPGMDGMAFYRELQDRRFAGLGKIIFITGDPSSREIEEFLNSLDNPLVNKPFSLEELRETIRLLITGSFDHHQDLEQNL